MKPGDIILVRGKLTSITDDLIKVGEYLEDKTPVRSNYTHVAIFMGDGKVAEAQGGRKTGYQDLDFYADDYDVGEVTLTDEQREAVCAETIKQFGLSYDWLLDVKLGVDMLAGEETHFHEKSKRICSTYVQDVFINAIGLRLSPKDIPTPEDIALSPYVKVVK